MFSLKHESKQIKIILFITAAVFFIINLFVVLKFGNRFLLGSLEKMNNDDVKYIRSALTLMNKGIFTYHNPETPTVFIMPGIVFTLVPFIKLFGIYGALTAFRIFQAVLQVLSLFLIFFIARKAFCSKAGIVACIMDTFYTPEITSTCKILTEVEFKFLLLLLVYISLYAIETKRTRFYVTGAVIWAFACLFRPTIALIPLAILAAWLINRYSFKEILKYALISSAVFAIIMSPWWIRNYITFKEFIPLTHSSGNPFLHGTYINYQGFKATILGDKGEFNLGIKRFRENIKKQPVRYLAWYTVGKSKYFWRQPYTSREVGGALKSYSSLYHKAILLLVLAGILLVIAGKQKINAFLIIVILYFNIIYLPYLTCSRYSYPVMPLVIILSAYAVERLINKAFGITGKLQANA